VLDWTAKILPTVHLIGNYQI